MRIFKELKDRYPRWEWRYSTEHGPQAQVRDLYGLRHLYLTFRHAPVTKLTFDDIPMAIHQMDKMYGACFNPKLFWQGMDVPMLFVATEEPVF